MLQKPFSVFLLLLLGTAFSISHWFSILMAMSVQICGQSWTSRASCATVKGGCDTSPSGGVCAGGEPKEARSPPAVPRCPPALVTAGCRAKGLFMHANADRGPQRFTGSAPVGLPASSILSPNDRNTSQ